MNQAWRVCLKSFQSLEIMSKALTFYTLYRYLLSSQLKAYLRRVYGIIFNLKKPKYISLKPSNKTTAYTLFAKPKLPSKTLTP